ncbi:MAG: hypothetical protein IKW20_07470, partial [Bacteroidales bacterium]|nr:hypothetical protein [Bacteroidales bacterium]
MVIEPNCCWKWMRLNEIFPSFVSAKSALNASKEELKEKPKKAVKAKARPVEDDEDEDEEEEAETRRPAPRGA